MQLNPRIIVGFASFAFVIATIVGGVAGVPFGVLIVRDLVAAASAAVFGGLASVVIARYLPELNEALGGKGAGGDDGSGEERLVDVVIGDDDAEPMRSRDDDSGGRFGDELIEEVQEVALNDDPALATAVSASEVGDDVADIDALPDIGALSGAFGGSSAGGDADSGGGVVDGGSYGGGLVSGETGDAATMAKAIQRMLKDERE